MGKIPFVITVVTVVLLISFYLELLGLQIVYHDITLGEAWSIDFIFGALRTASGAAILGILMVLIGMIPRCMRPWIITHAASIWSLGAALFLLLMWLLILWAP
ncbi:MAG: hypothetical protein JJU37_02180 [Balneolaceae bacterium]|nr:hypothetical protein [Balneolaceae bacterium]